MRKCLVFIILIIGITTLYAQEPAEVKDGKAVFYFPDGSISSEGIMRDGKPDGYWKTYYENGELKSEGNRKNFELDSIWTFYSDAGDTLLQIAYQNGKKEGIRRTIREDEVIEERFSNDVKQGLTIYYYPEGQLKRTINFENGLENGLAREYSTDGTVTTLIEYRRGFVIDRENINRKDSKGLRQGKWKYFYDDGKVKLEGTYRDDKRNGYFKTYDDKGMLVEISKYANDVKQEQAPELAKLDVKTDYYPSGKVKTVASYLGDVPEGIRREFSEGGEVIAAYTYNKGKLIAEGIIDEEGVRDGDWKEFYADGQLRAEGRYVAGKRVGKWKFYHSNGNLEQEGNYNNQGNADGVWRWYFDNNSLLREENFINGLSEGIFTEYDENKNVVIQGEYVYGLEEGLWKYQQGDHREEGYYRGGMRNGEWKYFYDDGTLSYEGSYIDDNPNGRHTWYWPDGKRKEEGTYLNGIKTGDWIQYNPDGTVFLVISYKNGVEKKYDGIKIKPEMTE